MRYSTSVFAAVVIALITSHLQAADAPQYRRLSVKEYRDKMKAGWIGQIAGVSWAAPTEFKFRDTIMPESAMPKWQPRMINDAFGQDDLYVEMTFLRTLEQHGLDCTIRQAGIDFANSGYPLWCANDAGRKNLRKGIAPPDSSHPKFNKCPNDIDYQIEADFSGLIAPGMPNAAIALGEKFGRLMNYGDGMYAGQFMGALYAEAFFEKDIVKVVEAGLKAIPAESQYAEMVRDLLKWSKEVPSWEACWQLCQDKYRKNPEYQKASNGGIDCKINGAYVLMGLLYGKGDLDQTIIISCRCGQDSDCNPSSAAGVLFTTIGFANLPERFSKELNEKPLFSHTAYNVPGLLNVCESLARQAIKKEGGSVEKDASGDEVFVIPVKPAKPSSLELSWAPGPIANSTFTETEMSQITATGTPDTVKKAFEKFAPGWTIADCGTEMSPGLRAEALGRTNVFVTHPLDQNTACVLSRKMDVPAGKTTTLKLAVGHDPKGDWQLLVRADMQELLRKKIGKSTCSNNWLDVTVDLSEYAGKSVLIELFNKPTGWSYEAGYWSEISTTTATLDTSLVPGVVLDHSPKSSGKYIGSPSIAILPNGDYVASHDFFGPRANSRSNATSVVFSSADKGKSWRKIATITPLFWGKLFVHKDALYILGTRHEYGDMLIRRSTDNGKTWTEPKDSATGLLRKGSFHCAPCQTLLHNNRIWRSMEVFTGGPWGNFEAMVISAPVDADLLNADNWSFSERLPKNPAFSWLEGAVLLAPDNTIVNMLRTNGSGDDKAAIVHVAEDGKTLSFNPATDVIDMPGGGVKFTIRYDKATSRYWAIVNKQTNPKAFRNNLLLVSSTDLKAWRTEATLQNHADSSVHAWQYIDWQFEGNDIIYLSRTAFDDGLGGAHRAHDANFLTFHRIVDFRNP